MYYEVSCVIVGKSVTHLNLVYQSEGFGLEDLRSILSHNCLIPSSHFLDQYIQIKMFPRVIAW